MKTGGDESHPRLQLNFSCVMEIRGRSPKNDLSDGLARSISSAARHGE